jgi:serine/threonine protein phosphatase 1
VTRATRYGARINIDTGAYYSGRLTALRIWRGRGRYLTT